MKMDYKKMTMVQMIEWIQENEKSADNKKAFKDVACGKEGKFMTVKAKKKFYELYKDVIEFENAPKQNAMTKAEREQKARKLLAEW